MATGQGGNAGRMAPWVGWALTFLTLLVIGGLVLWWVMTVGLQPVEHPSASPSATGVASAATTGFAQVNGRWCPTSPEDWDEVCVTITLPEVMVDGDDTPLYVFPPDGGDGADPSTFVYDDLPNAGDCWNLAVDVYPGESGVPFWYCPAGAVSGDESIDSGDASQDRMFMSNETEYPYLRED